MLRKSDFLPIDEFFFCVFHSELFSLKLSWNIVFLVRNKKLAVVFLIVEIA